MTNNELLNIRVVSVKSFSELLPCTNSSDENEFHPLVLVFPNQSSLTAHLVVLSYVSIEFFVCINERSGAENKMRQKQMQFSLFFRNVFGCSTVLVCNCKESRAVRPIFNWESQNQFRVCFIVVFVDLWLHIWMRVGTFCQIGTEKKGQNISATYITWVCKPSARVCWSVQTK